MIASSVLDIVVLNVVLVQIKKKSSGSCSHLLRGHTFFTFTVLQPFVCPAVNLPATCMLYAQEPH